VSIRIASFRRSLTSLNSVVLRSTKNQNASGSKSPRAVIITADDFGLSREVNAAVISTFCCGVLTSTSLMIAGAARDEAVSLAREHPGLDVGLHIVVCGGSSMLPPIRLHGLVDAVGRFGQQPTLTGMRYFFGRRVRSYLRDELRAQVDAHLERVGYLNHLDGHLNFHVHPAVASILVALATEYRIPCIRLPREPVLTSLRLAADHFPQKIIESLIFRTLSQRMFKLMQARGIRTTDRLFGLHQTGHMSEAYVLGVIDHLACGTTEIYFHPAEDIGGDPPLAAAQIEAQILKSARVRERLMAADVRLTSFAEMAKRAQS
jgi:chitin disaccharide deacetylase